MDKICCPKRQNTSVGQFFMIFTAIHFLNKPSKFVFRKLTVILYVHSSKIVTFLKNCHIHSHIIANKYKWMSTHISHLVNFSHSVYLIDGDTIISLKVSPLATAAGSVYRQSALQHQCIHKLTMYKQASFVQDFFDILRSCTMKSNMPFFEGILCICT